MLFVLVNIKASLPACMGCRKSCCHIEAGISSEQYGVVFHQVTVFAFPFSSSTLEEVVLRASETLKHCLCLYDLFCRY